MAEESTKPKVWLEIVSQEGTCEFGHCVGQKFDVSGPTPEGMCPTAFHSAYPAIYAVKYGANFPWEKEAGTATAACPDSANPVVMRIRREG